MRLPAVLAGLLAAQLACGDRTPESPPPAPAATTPITETSFDSPDGLYHVELPSRWSGHFKVDSLSTAERGLAEPRALVFSYLPGDTSVRPQALAVIAVYDSAAWVAVRAEGGPPPGDSVASKGGRVFVVGLPQSNPFPARSTDAVLFGLLMLKPAEVAQLVAPR